MNIYLSPKVDELLCDIGASDVYHSKRLWYIKTYHPALYNEILLKTSSLVNATFAEQLCCYANGITKRPICKVCSKEVSLSRGVNKVYHTYCTNKCAMKDMPDKIGVANASQLQSTKDKKKEKSIEKFGVDNVSKSAEVKTKLSEIRTEYWDDKLNSIIRELKDTTLYMSKKEYNKLVWRITERSYNMHINLIDPNRIRGNDYQLDHKISRTYGFYNKIPPEIIGDLTNLELLTAKENNTKGYKNSISINDLYEAYNNFYMTHSKPPICELYKRQASYTIVIEHTAPDGNCFYCGESASFQIGKKGRWCCAASPNSCPANRLKNSLNQINSEKKKQSTVLRKQSTASGD